MGKDLPLKTFLTDDKRFADVINGFCCAGEQRVKPEDLQELDTTEIVSMKQKRKREMRRDVIRKVALGVNFAIVGVENQEKVDYSLPYRIMAYDANRYGKQVAAIKSNIREVKKEAKDNPDKKVTLNSGEYMYDFRKDSRLHPVVTLVLYYGREEYDGATDLHGIIDFTDVPEHLKHMVQNYHVNMIDIRRYENFDMLHTDVKTVFELIRDSTDKEKWQRIKKENLRLEKDAFMVVAAYTNMKDAEMVIEKYETEEGEVDMCKAWEDWHQDGVEQGIAKGIEKGIEQGIEQGIARGITQGEQRLAIALVKDGILTIASAASRLGITEEELLQHMEGQVEVA